MVEVDFEEARDFVDKHHIQGACKASLCLGLRHKGELVSVAMFGKHHRQYQKNVLKRFVSKSGILVVGGMSRISKEASRRLGEIITWADRRWGQGNSYLKSGWIKEKVLPPDYFYIRHGDYYCSKQSRRKSVVNTPIGMTEHDHALKDGLFRVYDCGKIRFIYKKFD